MSRFKHRPPRIDIREPAVLINSDGTELDVVVLDISSAGCRIETDEVPRKGEKVVIRNGRGCEFPAEIRWVLGNQAGALFLTPARLGI